MAQSMLKYHNGICFFMFAYAFAKRECMEVYHMQDQERACHARISHLRDVLRNKSPNSASFLARNGCVSIALSQDKTGASRFYGDGTGRRIIPGRDK